MNIKEQLEQWIEQAAKEYDSKFMEEGNFKDSFHCATSYKAGANEMKELLLILVESLNLERIKPDLEMEEDGCTCVACGSMVDVDDNDWENGIDACWECKAHAYDNIILVFDRALAKIQEKIKGE